MPHVDFDAARRAYQHDRDPVTFDFGGERFTVLPDPSLGDTFDLMDAPEPVPENEQQAARILARFIRRMLPDDDRPRFDLALLRIPSSQATVLLDVAEFVSRNVTTRPTVPPGISSPGRRTTGRRSTPRAAGRNRSS